MVRGHIPQRPIAIGQEAPPISGSLPRQLLTDMNSGSGLTVWSRVRQRLPTTIMAKRVTATCDSEGEAVSAANGSRGPAPAGTVVSPCLAGLEISKNRITSVWNPDRVAVLPRFRSISHCRKRARILGSVLDSLQGNHPARL
jgi:hypothetical protein